MRGYLHFGFDGPVTDDLITGDEEDNTLDGTGNNDTIYGLGGNDTMFGEDGHDRLFGGDGNDVLYGNGGRDILKGGAGDNTYGFYFNSFLTPHRSFELNASHYDTIIGFDFAAADQFEFRLRTGGHFTDPQPPAGIDDTATGSLSKATFKADLKAMWHGHLDPGYAALVEPAAGDLAGHLFLVVDVDGIAGFQPKNDFVVELRNAHHVDQFDMSDFSGLAG